MVQPKDIEAVRRVLDEEISREEAANTLSTRQLAMLGGTILHAGEHHTFKRRKYGVVYGDLLYTVAVRAGKPSRGYSPSNGLVNAAQRLGVHYSVDHTTVALTPRSPEWMSPLLSDRVRYERARAWCHQANNAIQAQNEEQERKDEEDKVDRRLLQRRLRALREDFGIDSGSTLHPKCEAEYHEKALRILEEFGYS